MTNKVSGHPLSADQTQQIKQSVTPIEVDAQTMYEMLCFASNSLSDYLTMQIEKGILSCYSNNFFLSAKLLSAAPDAHWTIAASDLTMALGFIKEINVTIR